MRVGAHADAAAVGSKLGKGGMFNGALGGLGADGEPADVQAQLRDALARSGARVVELFRQWDVDGDGTVSKEEFVRSLPQLGLQATNEAASALFDTFDPDGSGTIELKELEKLLRNRVGQLAGTAVMVGLALLPRPISPPIAPAYRPTLLSHPIAPPIAPIAQCPMPNAPPPILTLDPSLTRSAPP